jgi:hypothetical protein
MGMCPSGYRCPMPGDDDGLTPDAAPTGGRDQHTRIADKERFADKPEADGLPDEEGVDDAALDDGLDEDPERVRNRRDVPPTPENSIEARTEDGEEPTGV